MTNYVAEAPSDHCGHTQPPRPRWAVYETRYEGDYRVPVFRQVMCYSDNQGAMRVEAMRLSFAARPGVLFTVERY